MLRERDFALFFWGQAVSVLGDGLFPIALAFAVLELGGSPTELGLVLVAGILPQVLFLLVGGVWADRLPRRTIMIAADAVRALVQAVTAVLLLSGEARIWQLAVLYALHATASAFFNPAATALVPQVTPRDRLQQANALLGMTRSLAAGLGAGLGGVLVSLVSTGGAVAFDACTFVVSAACLAALSLRSAGAAARTRFLSELRAGFDEVRRHRWLWLGLHQRLPLPDARRRAVRGHRARGRSARARRRVRLGADPDRVLGRDAAGRPRSCSGCASNGRCSSRGCSSSRPALRRCCSPWPRPPGRSRSHTWSRGSRPGSS